VLLLLLLICFHEAAYHVKVALAALECNKSTGCGTGSAASDTAATAGATVTLHAALHD
jgi:hypothetical protein